MRILALETTDRSGSVAALQGAEVLAELQLDPDQRSAQSLAPTLHRLLAQVGWKAIEVELVAVTEGPGSFTGLRVGVTTAKTLAYVAKAAIVGINSLEVIARQDPERAQRIVAVMDAQRQELFVAEFANEDGRLSAVRPTEIVAADQWLASLSADARIMGPGLRKYTDELPAAASIVPAEFWKPRAATVGLVGWEQYNRGEVSDPWKLVPVYLRRSAAEEQWEAKGK